MKKKQDESQLLVRFPSDLFEDVKRFAESHERSLNGEIVWALRQYVEQQKKEEEKARMIEAIDQVKPLVSWREHIDQGKAVFHATLPYERAGKVEGKYIHEYDTLSTAGERVKRKFKDTLFPKYFDTFEELVASCDERDLWSDAPTAEAYINRMQDMFISMEEYVIEPDMDEEDIEAIPEDMRLTHEDLETIKKHSKETFAEMRRKGMKKWSEDIRKAGGTEKQDKE
jgi:molybdopterin converting factor small subunit